MKHVGFIVLIILITFAFWLLLYFGESLFLDYVIMIEPPIGVFIEDWLYEFVFWGTIVLVVTGMVAIFWYIGGEWIMKFNRWEKVNKRSWWGLGLVPIIIVIVVACVIIPPPDIGAWWAYAIYVFNGLLCYYLTTALLSPNSVKYTPVLASKIRKW